MASCLLGFGPSRVAQRDVTTKHEVREQAVHKKTVLVHAGEAMKTDGCHSLCLPPFCDDQSPPSDIQTALMATIHSSRGENRTVVAGPRLGSVWLREDLRRDNQVGRCGDSTCRTRHICNGVPHARYCGVRWRRAPAAFRAMGKVRFIAGFLASAWALHAAGSRLPSKAAASSSSPSAAAGSVSASEVGKGHRRDRREARGRYDVGFLGRNGRVVATRGSPSPT